MECIQALFNLAQDNQLLVFFIAIFATFMESFIPALPLTGIVIANGLMLGFFGGVIASSIGSCIGTSILFLIASKFSSVKYLDKLKNDKTEKIMGWVKSQGFITMFICYSCPFIPGCLVTLASGFSGKKIDRFLPGMICGKFVMFVVSSYVGNDISGFISSPFKIIMVALLTLISFIIGKRINAKMEAKYDDRGKLIAD